MKRINQNFNRNWQFLFGHAQTDCTEVITAEGWVEIGLPHSFSIPYDLH